MKALALALVLFGCEHDPRYEKKFVEDKGRPEPAVAPAQTLPTVERTIDHPVFAAPKVKRPHHHHH